MPNESLDFERTPVAGFSLSSRKTSPSLLSSTFTATSSSTSSPEAQVFPGTYCNTTAITTWEQAERWSQFVNEFYVVKNLTLAYGSFVLADYIQHNPSVGQGAAAGNLIPVVLLAEQDNFDLASWF